MPKEISISEPTNILVVDDDQSILDLLSHLLKQERHQVRTARDGDKALQLALEDCPDVIITDWVMPGINGLELCRRIRQLYEHRILKHYSYILLLTAQTGRQNLLDGLNAGADDFIEKAGNSFTDLKVEILVRLNTAIRMRNMQRELEYSAKYDFSTDLLNRSTFFEQGKVLWTDAVNQETALSAVMIDCDYFKRVNDTYGHHAGDLVLKSTAAILQKQPRKDGVICRYGGEEFCALLFDYDENGAVDWAECARQCLEATPVEYDNTKINITASFGVAEKKGEMVSLDQLVGQADQALLFAKESGRNCTVRYSDVLADRYDPNVIHRSYYKLFDGITAEDVMVPLVLTVSSNEKVATVAELLMKVRIESLPVVDDQGDFIGFISEKNLLTLVGDKERWQDSIQDIVTKSIVVYSPDTPLKTIYNFLVRVSKRLVLIVKDQKPVGYIARNLLLHWLRNRWAFLSFQDMDDVSVPNKRLQTTAVMKQQIDYLVQQLDEIRTVFTAYGENMEQEETPHHNHQISEIVSHASKAQEIIEQVLIANAGFANQQLVDANLLAATAGEVNSIMRYGMFE